MEDQKLQEGRLQQLEEFTFIEGSGNLANKTLCVMEAVAYVSGENVSDHPQCASPALTEFAIRINDAKWWADDAERTSFLRKYVPLLVGTRDAALEPKRVAILVDAALCEFAPAALRAAITA